MKLVKINPTSPAPEAINQAAETLKSGGLVVYPTDTAYGLGANALDETAVRKMYEAKGRDFLKPTHIVVRDWKMIEELAKTNELARKLYEAFLPGPLTIILEKKSVVPQTLTASLPTIGLRIPNSPTTRALSEAVEFPYTTPSANLSGGETPYTADAAVQQLGRHIDLVLNAGKLAKVRPSTLVDTTHSPPQILRAGPITKERIENTLGLTVVDKK